MLKRVREICAFLPGWSEEVDKFGHTSLRVGKRPFIILGESAEAPSLAVKSDALTQDTLVRRPGYSRTPYIGQHGWISVRTDSGIEWPLVEDLIHDAYRQVAPKRLVRLLDGG